MSDSDNNLIQDLLITVNLCDIIYDINKTVDYRPSNKEIYDVFLKLQTRILFLENKQTSTQAGIVYSNDMKKMYIVVRGTDSFTDFADDLDIAQKNPMGSADIKFHTGFHDQAVYIFKKIINNIQEFMTEGGREIILCGGSVGGVIASVMAYYIKVVFEWRGDISVYMYGSPIFTNDAGVAWFENNIPNYKYIVNRGDPIPRLPYVYYIKGQKYVYDQTKKDIMVINSKTNTLKIQTYDTGNSLLQFLLCGFYYGTNIKFHSIKIYREFLYSYFRNKYIN